MKPVLGLLNKGGLVLFVAATILLIVLAAYWAINRSMQLWQTPSTVVMYSGRKVVIEQYSMVNYPGPPVVYHPHSKNAQLDAVLAWYGSLKPSRWERFGISVGEFHQTTPLPTGSFVAPMKRTVTTTVRIEYLLALCLIGSLAGFWLRSAARRQLLRRSEGRCINCGYDLRATPDRCPECGTATSTPVRTSGSPP